jgi:hypothetical protein
LYFLARILRCAYAHARHAPLSSALCPLASGLWSLAIEIKANFFLIFTFIRTVDQTRKQRSGTQVAVRSISLIDKKRQNSEKQKAEQTALGTFSSSLSTHVSGLLVIFAQQPHTTLL